MNKFVYSLVCVFLLGVVLFFVYEKVKNPGLTVEKQKNIKASQHKDEHEEIVAEVKSLMERLVKNPRDVDALNRLGDIFSSIRQWEKAEYFYRRLSNELPNDPKVKEKLAMCYFYMQEYSLALMNLKDVLKVDPDNVNVHFNIGLLYSYFFNDKSKAKEHFLFVINSKKSDEKTRKLAQEEIKKLNAE